MTTTTTTINSLLADCRAEAIRQGMAEDEVWEPTAADMEWVVERLGAAPTAQEWENAGAGRVGLAHCRLMETWVCCEYTGQYDPAMRPAALQEGDHVILPGGDAEADAREWSGFRALMDRAGLELGDDWEQDGAGRDEVSLVKRRG